MCKFIITSHHEAATLAYEAAGWQFETLLEGLIERQSIGLIVGPPKSKKTMFALNLALAISSGRPFLGRNVSPKPERVCYLSLELTRKAMAIRLRQMGANTNNLSVVDHNDLLEGSLFIDPNARTVDNKLIERIVGTLNDWNASVFIIDPLYYAIGEENDNVLVTEFLRAIDKIRRQTDATVIVVHHTRKAKSENWDEPFLMGRGASALGAFFEWVLGIQPDKGPNAKIHHGSRNLVVAPAINARFDDVTLHWLDESESSEGKALQNALGGSQEMPARQVLDRIPDSLAQNLQELNNLVVNSSDFEFVSANHDYDCVIRELRNE